MELQKTVGQLGTKVDRLIDDVREQGKTLDAVKTKIAWVVGGAAAVGAILGLIAAGSQFPWGRFIVVAPADHQSTPLKTN